MLYRRPPPVRRRYAAAPVNHISVPNQVGGEITDDVIDYGRHNIPLPNEEEIPGLDDIRSMEYASPGRKDVSENKDFLSIGKAPETNAMSGKPAAYGTNELPTEIPKSSRKTPESPLRSLINNITRYIGVEEILILALIFLILDERIEDEFLLLMLIYILIT